MPKLIAAKQENKLGIVISSKRLLAENYGEISEFIEKFDTYSAPQNDNFKMHEVGINRGKFYTTYKTGNGSIQLSMEKVWFLKRFVRLSYFDKINSKIIRIKALKDL